LIASVVPATIVLQQAIALHRQGMLAEADQQYREVLRLEARNFDALHLRGVIAMQTGQPAQAEKLFAEALRIQPRHVEALANHGTALSALSRHHEAVRSYELALQIEPNRVGLWHNQGVFLQLLGRHEEAAESFRRLVEKAPNFDYAVGNLFQARRHGCDWRDFDALAGSISAAIEAGQRADQPFSLLSIDDSIARQRQCARLYAGYLCPDSPAPLWRGERYAHDGIRVAYVSADFRVHIVAFLMAGIYERHDPRRFETIGVSLTADDQSAIAQRTRKALNQFHNVSALNDAAAAQLLRDLEVDIAVDLTGFTQGCRPGLFARRPAPVQVSLLGFPGGMGVPYMDYLIADEVVVPESVRGAYAEKIVHLPDSFQANDERRSLLTATPTPSRAAAGLPADSLVLCCFNSSYKLNPAFFTIWARILQQVPGSILWLLAERPAVQQRLCEETAARGIDARRLVFAQRINYPEHLARLQLADLFLDTLPFNAGATASDALWAGVPVLTCAGEAFAARMGASLLRAAGLEDLITINTAEYERLAVDLARDPSRLAQYKQHLAANRASLPLFDTARYCRHLEAAYVQMWERVQRGGAAEGFAVPALESQAG